MNWSIKENLQNYVLYPGIVNLLLKGQKVGGGGARVVGLQESGKEAIGKKRETIQE